VVAVLAGLDPGRHAILDQALVEGRGLGVARLDDLGRQLADGGIGDRVRTQHDALMTGQVQLMETGRFLVGVVAVRAGLEAAEGLRLIEQRQHLLLEEAVVVGALVDPGLDRLDALDVARGVERHPVRHTVVAQVAPQAAALRVTRLEYGPRRRFGGAGLDALTGGQVEAPVAPLGVVRRVADHTRGTLAERVWDPHQGGDVIVGNRDVAVLDQLGDGFLVAAGVGGLVLQPLIVGFEAGHGSGGFVVVVIVRERRRDPGQTQAQGAGHRQRHQGTHQPGRVHIGKETQHNWPPWFVLVPTFPSVGFRPELCPI